MATTLQHLANGTIIFFLLALSISSIGLSFTALQSLQSLSHTATWYPQNDDTASLEASLDSVPKNLIQGPLQVIVTASSFCIVAGMLSCFVLFSSRITKPTFGAVILAGVGFFTSTIAFVYSMAAYYVHNKPWYYFDDGSSNATFTTENWTCGLLGKLPLTGDDDRVTICAVSKAARWMTIPLLLCVGLLLAVVGIEYRRVKHQIRTKMIAKNSAAGEMYDL